MFQFFNYGDSHDDDAFDWSTAVLSEKVINMSNISTRVVMTGRFDSVGWQFLQALSLRQRMACRFAIDAIRVTFSPNCSEQSAFQ
jgi:hypothetical protein